MWTEAARGGVQRERGTQNARRRAPRQQQHKGSFVAGMRYFLNHFNFGLLQGTFFFSPQPHSVGNPCELPGKGGKNELPEKGKKKKIRHEISSTPLIPCPHLPAFRTHTPPCSMCDHPCPWTEPSRTFQNVLHGIRKHIHARTCTPLPSAQYTHRFYCDVRGCIDSPVDKLEFFLCCLSLSLSPRQY